MIRRFPGILLLPSLVGCGGDFAAFVPTVPFSIDYFDALSAIAAVASGEKLRVNMDAAMDVTTPFGIIPLTVDETGDIDVVE